MALLNAATSGAVHGRRLSWSGRSGSWWSRSPSQIALGALVVLTGKQPLINTLHVATGATVLVTSLVLTLRAFRVRFDCRRFSIRGTGQQRSHA